MRAADATPTDRLFAVRPITARMPAVGGEPRRVPLTGQVARVADLLDLHVSGRLDTASLHASLHAQVWPRLPSCRLTPIAGAGTVLQRWHAALERELAPVLDQLVDLARPFLAAAAAEPDRCDRGCTAKDTCPWHRRQLGDWWDVLHPIAGQVLHDVPVRALAALGGGR